MAKWGEGDPRWIVEERPDAVNVNNWHWTEKNASHWSKDKLTKLMVGLKIEDPNVGHVELTELSTIDGDAVANNRKAKLIFFYEWLLKGVWVAKLNGQVVGEIEGEYEIPNLSEENEPHEVDVSFTVTKGDKHEAVDRIREMLRTKGRQQVRNMIAEYIRELKEEYAKDLILPTKDPNKSQTANTTGGKSVTHINKSTNNNSSTGSHDQKAATNVPTKNLELSEEMKCRAADFYRALIDTQMLQAFTQSNAICEAKVGGQFVLFAGNVEGSFIDLKENELIRQRWRFKGWPNGHYSEVTIKIEQRSDDTLVSLKQTSIPISDYERTENGWRRFYFDAMKRTFGFGSILF